MGYTIIDTITKIKKVGSYDDGSAEIFFTFKKFGDFSIDIYTCQNFWTFWASAHAGDRIQLLISDEGDSIFKLSLF